MRIIAIAQNTFREAVRDKVLYVLLFLAIATILGSKVIGWISIGQDIKVMKSISLGATSIFGVLIAVFIGTNLIYKEIDKRTIYTILCTPAHRFEFILGKYLGLCALLAVVTITMTCVSSSYVLLLGGQITTTYFLAAFLIYIKLMLMTALALLLSSLASPILGAIIVLAVYAFGHGTRILTDLPDQFGTVSRQILHVIYYILPNLANFELSAEAANDVAVAPGYVAWVVAYGTVYTVMLLILAAIAFEDKDV